MSMGMDIHAYGGYTQALGGGYMNMGNLAWRHMHGCMGV
jgi:hypothetical protein